jgi:hydrogenase maturation protease
VEDKESSPLTPRSVANKTLVLGLGNDLIADDAIGILAARRLRGMVDGRADVCESSLHGLALLESFLGYDHAVIVDAMQTGSHPPGTIVELSPEGLRPVDVPSPHFAGLPELIELAGRLELPFPSRIRILAVEVQDTVAVGGPMTPAVRDALDALCDRVRSIVENGEF